MADAPAAQSHAGPDRSRADWRFAWLALGRGWSVADVCAELARVSDHARRERGDYIRRTVERAAARLGGC